MIRRLPYLAWVLVLMNLSLVCGNAWGDVGIGSETFNEGSTNEGGVFGSSPGGGTDVVLEAAPTVPKRAWAAGQRARSPAIPTEAIYLTEEEGVGSLEESNCPDGANQGGLTVNCLYGDGGDGDGGEEEEEEESY